MSKIVDSFTGEAQKKAGKQAVKELARGREAVSELADVSRGTLFDLFGAGQESRRAGLQGALDVFGESIPLEAQVFQGGNVAAQQALLAGLPEIQAAIMGTRAPNLAGLTPTRQPFDLQFTNAQLPATRPIEAPAEAPPSTADLLSGVR